MSAEAQFDEFVASRSRALLRSAYLLTGDWGQAQDLVQTALIATWRRWDGLQRPDAPFAYVSKVMTTTFLSWRRRRWHGEHPTALLPERAAATDLAESAAVRDDVRQALLALPPRQRAVVVLRFLLDLSEAQTAAALGCAPGTVKSQTAKALATLRTSPALLEELHP